MFVSVKLLIFLHITNFATFSVSFEYLREWEIDSSETEEEEENVGYHGNAFDTFGPKFVDEMPTANVSVKKGSDAFLHCKVAGIGEQSVSWYKRKKGQIHLITFGFQTYHNDGRFSLTFVQPYDWRLRIRNVKHKDAGTYECQVSTHPPIVRTVHLNVVVPVMKLLDDRGVRLREKFYKTGSTIVLRCEVENVPTRRSIHLHWYHGRKRVNYDDPRGGVSVKTEIRGLSAKSWLRIGNAQPVDSGIYFCNVSGLKPVGGHVHIVKEEFPAAVQSASRALSVKILPHFTSFLIYFHRIFARSLQGR